MSWHTSLAPAILQGKHTPVPIAFSLSARKSRLPILMGIPLEILGLLGFGFGFSVGTYYRTRHFRVGASSRLSKTHPHKSKLLRSGLAEARSKDAYVSTVLLSVCEVLKRQGIEINIEAQEHLCAVHSHLLGRFYR